MSRAVFINIAHIPTFIFLIIFRTPFIYAYYSIKKRKLARYLSIMKLVYLKTSPRKADARALKKLLPKTLSKQGKDFLNSLNYDAKRDIFYYTGE